MESYVDLKLEDKKTQKLFFLNEAEILILKQGQEAFREHKHFLVYDL